MVLLELHLFYQDSCTAIACRAGIFLMKAEMCSDCSRHLESNWKLREEGLTSGRGGEKKGKTRQPLPWNHFLTHPNSVSLNVRDDWRTLMSLFDILFIFVIFKCNFRSIRRNRAGHKHKFWCRQARYVGYKFIVACWFTLQTLAPPPPHPTPYFFSTSENLKLEKSCWI